MDKIRQGLYLEDRQILLPWGVALAEVEGLQLPRPASVLRESSYVRLAWGHERLFKGLPGMLELGFQGQVTPSLQRAWFKGEDAIIHGDPWQGLEPQYTHLCRVLGPARLRKRWGGFTWWIGLVRVELVFKDENEFHWPGDFRKWIYIELENEHNQGEGDAAMAESTVKINRAPVLTLWAAVVAERLGYERSEALTLGKALAGLNAQSKGQRLGIFEPAPEKAEQARKRKVDETFSVRLLGRDVSAVNTKWGVRATVKGEAVAPESVERYIEKKFGEQLGQVQAAMEGLARSVEPEELEQRAYRYYEAFRPEIPEGVKGWGAAGNLDLDKIRKMAKEARSG